jgi:hypothetical protein
MRSPVAIGFYPADKKELENFVNELLKQKVEKRKAVAAIVPHAGYIYSGKVAGKVYSSILTESRKFLIACPNHTGMGKKVALSAQNWLTPLGEVRVNKDFANKVPVDEEAHFYEHSLEVQLPFLQVLFKDFEIIPLCLSHLEFSEIEKLAEILTKNDIFYIASSDFIHFGPNYGYMPFNLTPEENVKKVEELDKKAIKFIEKLDAKGFYNFVREKKLTICGMVPITLILLIAKNLGAKEGKLIAYSTSFEIHRNINFVSYAGILIY